MLQIRQLFCSRHNTWTRNFVGFIVSIFFIYLSFREWDTALSYTSVIPRSEHINGHRVSFTFVYVSRRALEWNSRDSIECLRYFVRVLVDFQSFRFLSCFGYFVFTFALALASIENIRKRSGDNIWNMSGQNIRKRSGKYPECHISGDIPEESLAEIPRSHSAWETHATRGYSTTAPGDRAIGAIGVLFASRVYPRWRISISRFFLRIFYTRFAPRLYIRVVTIRYKEIRENQI